MARRSGRKSRRPVNVQTHRYRSAVRGRRKSVIRSRGRRKSAIRSRGRRKKSKSRVKRIDTKRKYSAVRGGRPETRGSSRKRPRSLPVKEGRVPLVAPVDPGPQYFRASLKLEEGNLLKRPLPYPSMGEQEDAVQRLYDAGATVFLREIMRNELLTNSSLVKVYPDGGGTVEYLPLRLGRSPISVQVLPPINSTTFNKNYSNEYIQIKKPVGAETRYSITFLEIKLCEEIDSVPQGELDYKIFSDYDSFSRQEVLNMFVYGVAARFGHYDWDARDVPDPQEYVGRTVGGQLQTYLAACPTAEITIESCQELLQNPERARHSYPFGAGNDPRLDVRSEIRTIIIGRPELIAKSINIKSIKSSLDTKADRLGKEPFYVLYVPSDWANKQIVKCKIVWSAQAAEDFFKYALCAEDEDGAYVTREHYSILEPAVAALTSGDGSCAHWVGMRYPDYIEGGSIGVEMRQGYTCTYNRVPGYSCQKNLGHGLCMLNALIFALSQEKRMVSACDALAAADEPGQVLNTITLGFHINILRALDFVYGLITQNKDRFVKLGTLDLNDVLNEVPEASRDAARELSKTMTPRLASRDASETTMVKIIDFITSPNTVKQRNFWSENFCRGPDGSAVPIEYCLSGDGDHPRAFGGLDPV